MRQARAEATNRQERYFLPEILRLEGELHLLQDETKQAAACWQQAIQTARQQEAKTWELRACTALCRLWQSEGKHTQVQELLAPICTHFQGGFVSPDVVEAKALLDALVKEAT